MNIYQFGQWTIEIDEASGKYEMYNLGPNGEKRYFRVVPGAYNAPMFEPEPELAFACPAGLAYINAKGEQVTPDQKISGIICRGGLRASLSNARSKGIEIKTLDDGSIQVGDERWWLATLFQKDKNRSLNYDAYLSKERPEVVRVLELGDLDL